MPSFRFLLTKVDLDYLTVSEISNPSFPSFPCRKQIDLYPSLYILALLHVDSSPNQIMFTKPSIAYTYKELAEADFGIIQFPRNRESSRLYRQRDVN